jgi:segregation and condensation protein A
LDLGPWTLDEKMTTKTDHPNTEESTLALYRIEIDKFTGPLDLLLHLIKRDELDIYDIPIAEITRQYLEYLDIMREFNLEVASEFLVMASTLVYLKSRMLLPIDDEEEEEIETDPREELIRRLIEYQRYKTAAHDLNMRPQLGKDIFVRPELEDKAHPDDHFIEASLFQLMDAFARVLSEAEKRRPHEIIKDAFSIEDGVEHVWSAFENKKSMKFDELFTGSENRRKIVTIFLAILELMKRRQLMAVQQDHDGPLRLIVDDFEEVINTPTEGRPNQ